VQIFIICQFLHRKSLPSCRTLFCSFKPQGRTQVHHGGCTHRIVKAGLGTGCVCGHLTAFCPVPEFEITRSGRRAGVHGAVGCDVRGWYATRRELVGMARRPQPTSTTAAPLALDHIGDHDSGVRLQWLPSRVQPAETLPRALIKGRHCSRGRILPARRCFLCCCIPYDTIYITHEVMIHNISDMFCFVRSVPPRITAFMCLLRLCCCDTPPCSRTQAWPHNIHTSCGPRWQTSCLEHTSQSRLQFGDEFTATLCTSIAFT